MVRIYDIRHDGIYLPIRYYTHVDSCNVILVGSLHNGERSFYEHVGHILETCDVVIYEEPQARNAETMRALEESWSERLYDANPNEAFLASIFLPVPQKFMHDHDLYDEAHSFNYLHHGWVSGDGNWGLGNQNAGLSMEIWDQIMERIRSLDPRLKHKKVVAAKTFLEHVMAGRASIMDYLAFGNLYENEIQETVFQDTVVDSRDEVAFVVFDEMMRRHNPSRMGIKFGNGHLSHMDQLLRERGYHCNTARWLRIFTIT